MLWVLVSGRRGPGVLATGIVPNLGEIVVGLEVEDGIVFGLVVVCLRAAMLEDILTF